MGPDLKQPSKETDNQPNKKKIPTILGIRKKSFAGLCDGKFLLSSLDVLNLPRREYQQRIFSVRLPCE